MASLHLPSNVPRHYLKRAKQVLTSSFDYQLPAHRIASRPLPDRSSSKLLVVRGSADAIEDRHFSDLPTLLPSSSMLVMNSSKVIPARIPMQKAGGGRAELMLLSPVDLTEPSQLLGSAGWQKNWKCYLGGRRIRVGDELKASLFSQPGSGLKLLATVLDKSAQSAIVSFRLDTQQSDSSEMNVLSSARNAPVKREEITFGHALELAGQTPLPPYIKRQADFKDEAQYQTVYADTEGSVAAPTAGLHMTNEILHQIALKGIDIAQVTLHVSAGTFAQIDGENIGSHSMHEERIGVSRDALERFLKQIKNRSPIVALGTTSVRTLESLYWYGVRLLCDNEKGLNSFSVTQWEPYERLDVLGESGLPSAEESYGAVLKWTNEFEQPIFGETKLLIVPGYPFKVYVGLEHQLSWLLSEQSDIFLSPSSECYQFLLIPSVDALVTNFHQPKSTLLMLVSAFLEGPPEELSRVYEHGLKSEYRFLSYGDSSMYAHPDFFSMTTQTE